MSITITGIVQSVTKGKPFTYSVGPQTGKQGVTNKINIETDTGNITVNKNSLATTNFNLATGTKVQATFDEKIAQTKDGKTFTNNNLVKDGLLILTDEGAPQAVTASGAAKPAFVSHNTPPTLSAPIKASGSSYSSEGARNGMIVNASLALATARKGALDLSSLKQAADDIKALTSYVETGKSETPAVSNTNTVTKQVLKTLPKKQVEQLDDEEDEDPFA